MFEFGWLYNNVLMDIFPFLTVPNSASNWHCFRPVRCAGGQTFHRQMEMPSVYNDVLMDIFLFCSQLDLKLALLSPCSMRWWTTFQRQMENSHRYKGQRCLPFVCQFQLKQIYCGEGFETERQLNMHQAKMHTDEEKTSMHRCLYPGCTYGTINETNLAKQKSSMHIPPRIGQSCALAGFVALISLAIGCSPERLGLTVCTEPNGIISQVGGLEEKLMRLVHSGINNVLVPNDNHGEANAIRDAHDADHDLGPILHSDFVVHINELCHILFPLFLDAQ
ncbi:hypothetical protein niasHT_010931 [Heterodera trifolii]|uniref:C2H2-type domain-containing protein n=1 Tax=Heterodera trifolii TaxID=157864 RepID=A0ABD2LGV1_9BILA